MMILNIEQCLYEAIEVFDNSKLLDRKTTELVFVLEEYFSFLGV